MGGQLQISIFFTGSSSLCIFS